MTFCTEIKVLRPHYSHAGELVRADLAAVGQDKAVTVQRHFSFGEELFTLGCVDGIEL